MSSSIVKKLHLGRLAYWSYYAPKSLIHRWIQRDPLRRSIDAWGQQQMEAAAHQLQPLTVQSQNPPEIHFLSGHKFWYQTCFCAYSMVQQAKCYLRPVIYDDGTLQSSDRTAIQRIFPDVRIVDYQEIEAHLDANLPPQKFPALRSNRLTYPHLRKLTDIHAGSTGWKLVLDSDMLFFQPPRLLMDWLRSPQSPCHMVDIKTMYGYSNQLMTELTGAPIPERINVGVCGLQSKAIDWEELEFWCKTMIDREGKSYYQEQAITAMLMARQPRVAVPAETYVVMPERAEVLSPQATLHHYVDTSKPWYFRYAWKHIINHPKLSSSISDSPFILET